MVSNLGGAGGVNNFDSLKNYQATARFTETGPKETATTQPEPLDNYIAMQFGSLEDAQQAQKVLQNPNNAPGGIDVFTPSSAKIGDQEWFIAT